MKKNILSLLILTLALFVFVACDNKPDTPDDKTPNVESVEITNEVSTLVPGNYTLTAVAHPEKSNQLVKFTLVGAVEGVTLSGTTLTVSVNAIDQTKFKVRVSSVYDPTKISDKEFTVNNPELIVEIATEDDLFNIATAENGLAQKYVLKNNIVLTKPWLPIGVADVETDTGEIVPGNPFIGSFDGKGFTISGIVIEGEFNVGFFGQIGATGIVKNTAFIGTVNARGWSGGVAGINEGTIENVVADIDVTVAGGSAGALVSVNRGKISYSYAIGTTVSGTDNALPRSAGLVAANEGQLVEVYADKDALTTTNYVAFNNLQSEEYMLGTLAMKTANTFAEFNTDVWFIEDGNYPLLKHEGFTAPTEKEVSIIITNDNTEVDAEKNTTLQVTTSVINGTLEDVLVYSIDPAVVGVSIDQTGLITFTSEVANNVFVTIKVTLEGNEEVFTTKTIKVINNPVPVEDVVEISTEAELKNLASQANPAALAKTYKLVNDIALEGWFNTKIGNADLPFTGTFDGQGFTISGLKGGDMQHDFAMFGVIGETGVVKNLNLVGAEREADMYVGASTAVLASTNYGTIENIFSNVTILSTGPWVAGFVANNYGTIRNVISLNKAYRNDSFTDLGPAFAIANEGTIENCFVDSDVVASTTFLNEANETLDAFLVDTATLKTAATFANFDSNIWNIVEGEYPTLKSIE